MKDLRADEGRRVVVLSGAGLSKASGIPTFRDAEGLWEGHEVTEVATPEAWARDPATVRRFYDERRIACAAVMPNDGHFALSRLQHALGVKRCTLITQNIDGLLQKASAEHVIEMHGSLFRLRCADHREHPLVGVFGAQNPSAMCKVCGAPLRPDVVWFGEIPYDMDAIQHAVEGCDLFISVGTSGVVYPAAGLVSLARAHGAHTVEINPVPSGAPFDEQHVEPAEIALPRVVGAWLGEDIDED
ncbi:MAG: NAD-dependent deacylase [Myxococcales bacterium]|nr:NAD-dependent deacylase [Myxococcales bacterium]MCB9668281.1 NAD-dependent deacylase [Alphaproteobacteria bacterium]